MAYYPFNGDSDDESGNMHHGTVETHFKSSLDEVAFYDRPLTTLEILQLYKRLRPHHEPA